MKKETDEQKYGISDDRLQHMLGVARKAYAIAKEKGFGDAFAKKMFVAGFLHDIGYEFCDANSEHAKESGELVSLIDDDTVKAISLHGKYFDDIDSKSAEWLILNMADMQVSPDGKEVDVSIRLADIKERFGEHSDAYLTACDICYQIGLTAVNLAGDIT